MTQAIAHPQPPPAPKGEISTQDQICELLHWSADQYSEYLYSSGLAYLQAYLPEFSDGIYEKFENSRVYWNWYKLLHERLDMGIVYNEGCEPNSFQKLSVDVRRTIYENVHRPNEKVKEYKPNKIVWQGVMDKWK